MKFYKKADRTFARTGKAAWKSIQALYPKTFGNIQLTKTDLYILGSNIENGSIEAIGNVRLSKKQIKSLIQNPCTSSKHIDIIFNLFKLDDYIETLSKFDDYVRSFLVVNKQLSTNTASRLELNPTTPSYLYYKLPLKEGYFIEIEDDCKSPCEYQLARGFCISLYKKHPVYIGQKLLYEKQDLVMEKTVPFSGLDKALKEMDHAFELMIELLKVQKRNDKELEKAEELEKVEKISISETKVVEKDFTDKEETKPKTYKIFNHDFSFTLIDDVLPQILGSSNDHIFIECNMDGTNFRWGTFSQFGEEKYREVDKNRKELIAGINEYLIDIGKPTIIDIQTPQDYEPFCGGYTDGEREYLESQL